MTVSQKGKEIFDMLSKGDCVEESKIFWKDLVDKRGINFSILVTKELCELIQQEADYAKEKEQEKNNRCNDTRQRIHASTAKSRPTTKRKRFL